MRYYELGKYTRSIPLHPKSYRITCYHPTKFTEGKFLPMEGWLWTPTPLAKDSTGEMRAPRPTRPKTKRKTFTLSIRCPLKRGPQFQTERIAFSKPFSGDRLVTTFQEENLNPTSSYKFSWDSYYLIFQLPLLNFYPELEISACYAFVWGLSCQNMPKES